MANFCHHAVKKYAEIAARKQTHELKRQLFDTYDILNKHQRGIPHFRHWRRCIIVELLNRDELAVDPGPKKAERSKHE